MIVYNILVRFYGKLHNYKNVPFWVLTPIRRIVRLISYILLPRVLKVNRRNKGIVQKDLIVSFTSFPSRIKDVWQVVESLKNQSILPEKIILWLSREQFNTKDSIPISLLSREDELFEIRLVDLDLRSHKKYYYAMIEFPEKTIITCDDDIYYHPDMIKILLEGSNKFKGSIISNVTKQLSFYENGDIMPYNQWNDEIKAYSSENLFQIGVGGVLYPSNSLDKMLFRSDLFTSLTPLADDIWLNCMARMKNTLVIQSSKNILPLPIKSNSPTLTSVNCDENFNDSQLENLRLYLVKNGFNDIYHV